MSHEVDRAVAQLAAAQHGALSRAQALGAGATSSLIQRRVASGRWQRVADGVYVIAGSKPTWHRRLLVACLDAGPSAVASHRAAAALHGLHDSRQGPPEVLLPFGSTSRLATRVHRTRYLPPSHVTRVEQIPVTTIGRTIFDLAAVRPRRLDRVVDDALAARRIALTELMATLIELGRPGREGMALMRRLLSERGPGYVPPMSELEALLFELLRVYDIEEPVRQSPLPSNVMKGILDTTWPWAHFIVEVDGRRWHAREEAMETDRRRDIEAGLHGYTIARFMWGDLVREPEWVAGVINHHLDKARPPSVCK
jgi:very-short-patch-repair endonuclease